MSDALSRRGFARLALGGAVLLGAPSLARAERGLVSLRLGPNPLAAQASVTLWLTSHGLRPLVFPRELILGVAIDGEHGRIELVPRPEDLEDDLRSRAGPRFDDLPPPRVLSPEVEQWVDSYEGPWRGVAPGARFEGVARLALGPVGTNAAHLLAADRLARARVPVTLRRPA